MNKKSKSTLEKFQNILRVKGYSKKTIIVYSSYAKKFLNNFDKDLYHISKHQAKKFFLNYMFTSNSQQNQFISSIKKLYEYTLKTKLTGIEIERPRKENQLPKVIDNACIIDQLSKINNIKHLSILSLAYSVGLRVSEVINLKISDLDSKRKVITIRQSKGRKDRIVPLTDKIKYLLANYIKQYKPKIYVFNGQQSLKYSANSCNKLIKKYLGPECHFHMLRHSCFSNLTDQGIDLRVIQKLAGHKSSKTTEIYTHVSTQLLNKLPLAI